MKDFLELVKIRLKTEWFFFIEYLKSIFKYYGKFPFASADMLLVFGYFFRSPFKISREFLKSKGESNIYAYGETPLTTLEFICDKCNVTKEDIVYELGCGRGRTCFWLSQWLGCRVVGIEFVPQFVEIAKIITDKLELKNIEFRCGDFTESPLEGATVIYLFGTCLPDEDIAKLAANTAKLPTGTKVISVSYPLTDFAPAGSLEVTHRFPAPFSWGEADVYCQVVTSGTTEA